jgi:uncharacterized protein with NRDE domain
MEAALATPDPAPLLFEMLSDRVVAPDGELPATGVGIEWERRLASSLITGAEYGTRASTVLTVSSSGDVTMEERTRDAKGEVQSVALDSFVQRSGAVLRAGE